MTTTTVAALVAGRTAVAVTPMATDDGMRTRLDDLEALDRELAAGRVVVADARARLIAAYADLHGVREAARRLGVSPNVVTKSKDRIRIVLEAVDLHAGGGDSHG